MAEKIHQQSITEVIRPELKIISMSTDPVGTLYTVWHGSRNNKSTDPSDVQHLYEYLLASNDDQLTEVGIKSMSGVLDYDVSKFNTNKEILNYIIEIASQSIRANLPAAECVYFTIQVDNANVAWREQLVRSKFASYFMQTSRIYDMETMNISRNESIELLGGTKAVEIYNNTVDTIRNCYKMLRELGVPQEDIRLQPQMFTHRVYWMVSLRSLITVMSHRSDWIAQSTLWSPIISDLCREFRSRNLMNVVEEFIGNPPVQVELVNGEYKVTSYKNLADNQARYEGNDPAIPDPLWLAYTGNKMPKFVDKNYYNYLKKLFINIWNDKYLKVLGWDRDNPDKVGYYDPI